MTRLMPPWSVRDRLEEGRNLRGLVVEIPSPAAVEIAGIADCDIVIIDPSHPGMTRETVEGMVRAAWGQGLCALTVAPSEPWAVMTALDTGAHGVVLTGIRDAKSARAAVAMTRFPPHGRREANKPLRFQFMTMEQFANWTSSNIFVAILIGGDMAAADVVEIAGVPGVDAIMVAPGLLGTADIDARAAISAATGATLIALVGDLPDMPQPHIALAGSDAAILGTAYRDTADYLRTG